MYRLIKADRNSSQDFGLWPTAQAALDEAQIRVDKWQDLPERGWVIIQQTELRAYYLDPSASNRVEPFSIARP